MDIEKLNALLCEGQNQNKLAETAEALKRVYALVLRLRAENGCPWDKAQTPHSMRQYLIEETFEVTDAIENENPSHVKEELGDLLFNTILSSYMYEQNADFSVSEMADALCEKLVTRHPHVFGKDSAGFCEYKKQQVQNENSHKNINETWDSIKENVEHRTFSSILDSVPKGFPPLLKSYKFLKKAAKFGFEWKNISDAENKVLEEFNEVKQASITCDSEKIEEELGDLLLSVVNLCRMYNVFPDNALEKANKKFYKRFTFVEHNTKQAEEMSTNSPLESMERLWNEAKKLETVAQTCTKG